MKIGELATLSGLTPSRIRFYESAGLLHAVTRQANGYRDYPPEAALVLEIIVSAQQAGFSLEEISQLMPTASSTWQHDELIQALQHKIAEIDILEAKLRQNKGRLTALIAEIENRPDGLACEGNAKRILTSMRESTECGHPR